MLLLGYDYCMLEGLSHWLSPLECTRLMIYSSGLQTGGHCHQLRLPGMNGLLFCLEATAEPLCEPQVVAQASHVCLETQAHSLLATF